MTTEDKSQFVDPSGFAANDEKKARLRMFARGGRVVHRLLTRMYYYGDNDAFSNGWVTGLVMDDRGSDVGVPPILRDFGSFFDIPEVRGFKAGDIADATGSVLKGLAKNPPLRFETSFPDVFIPQVAQATSEKRNFEAADSTDFVIIKGVDGKPLSEEERKKVGALKRNLYPNPFSKKEPRVDISRLFSGIRHALGEGLVDWEICDVKVDFRGDQHLGHRARNRTQLQRYSHLTSTLAFGMVVGEANPIRVQQSFAQMDREWQHSPLSGLNIPDLSILFVAKDGTAQKDWIFTTSADVIRDE